MFPLVHYYVNYKLYDRIPKHTVLGGMWPDLAAAAGWNRNDAHVMGDDFYQWCMEHAPEGRDLARGIISHCSKPKCVDYYADEYWPGYHKGWCFLMGEPYMPEVAAATKLESNKIWWKAHNFVEISFELMTDEADPSLKKDLLAVLNDSSAIREIAELLSAYTGCPAGAICAAYAGAPQTFALENVSPEELAQKQHLSFIRRFDHHDADVPAMAALIRKMKRELANEYGPFLQLLVDMTGKVIRQYETPHLSFSHMIQQSNSI